MKKLITALSALALSAGMASAQTTTVFDAWDSEAQFVPKETPFDHNDPSTAFPRGPVKPGELEIEMRMFKTCTQGGQCAFVDQVGNNNSADVDQSAAPGGSVADIIQVGNFNAASIEQRDGPLGVLDPSHYGVITQNGDNNGANIRQHSDVVEGANYADIEQGGDGTIVGDPPTAGGPADLANDNWASIDQGIGANGGSVISYGNKAKIAQGTKGTGLVSDSNEAAIVQRGDQMLALIEQDGSSNEASILQTGNGGSANDASGEFNEARVTQLGDSNQGAILQDGQFQLASIDQVGDGNMASIQQDGTTTNAPSEDINGNPIEVVSPNTAVVIQNGDDNLSTILQQGDGNMASSEQYGDDNDSSIWQDGNDNMASVLQFNDGNYAAIEQFGNDNQASAFQDGFDYADIQQHGNNNIAAVNQ